MQQKKNSKRKTHGEQDIVIPYTYDGGDFPSRVSYYQHVYEQHLESQ